VIFPKRKKKEEIKNPLTAREEEILYLTARGYTNKEISDKLFISVKTVENHKTSLIKQLQVTTRAEVVQYGLLHVQNIL
jgi:two-component system response regulator NreC